jgi:hypothetical protein
MRSEKLGDRDAGDAGNVDVDDDDPLTVSIQIEPTVVLSAC